MAIDWLAIKMDYIAGNGSYRQLGEKYGVKKDTIYRKAKTEQWARQRDRQRDTIERRTLEKSAEKSAEKLAETYSEDIARKARIKNTLLDMIEEWLKRQGGSIQDVTDFRKMVQCCMDVLNNSENDTERAVRVVMEGETGDYAD